MSSRGSEICPIDLTADEYEAPAKKRKVKKVKGGEDLNSITQRLKIIEEKMQNIEQSKKSVNLSYAKRQSVVDFLVKCKSLESRLDSLESCLGRLSQVFTNNTIDLDPVANFEFDGNVSPPATPAKPQDLPNNSVELEQSADEPLNQNLQSVSVCLEACKASATSSSVDILEDPEPRIAETNQANETAIQNSENTSTEETVAIKSEWIRMPRLPSIKTELNLMRDDEGRILMFLCCSFKTICKNPPQIAAVAGMYLEDQLHNEFPFTSIRETRAVKIEAEMRAALFGIETVKRIYNETLDQLCVMVISSCRPLVRLMKIQTINMVYPCINSCSCEMIQCSHHAVRWASENPLGRSQNHILPELLLSLQGLRVHWCKVNNISDEEKKTAAAYSPIVEACLKKYVTQIRKM